MQKFLAYVTAVFDDYDEFQLLPTIDDLVTEFVNYFDFVDSPSSEEREFLQNNLIAEVQLLYLNLILQPLNEKNIFTKQKEPLCHHRNQGANYGSGELSGINF